MKKLIFLFLALSLLMVPVFASLTSPIKHNNIKIKSKITYNADVDSWSSAITKNTSEYYTKADLGDSKIVYLDKNGSYAFETDCDYEFIHNGKFICYSNKDLMFYQISLAENNINKVKLTEDEIQSILPDYKIIKISDFSQHTNSLKIKKNLSNIKIFLLNDVGYDFNDYDFTSGNSKLETYCLNGFVKVSKKGMIQFSKKDDETKSMPWYVILIR